MSEMHTVLKEFELISAVPRRSFYNKKIIEYCINWAIEHGFDYFHDIENNNVVIRKGATCGYENKPAVVLQGHLDMVAVADDGITHDWENEGIDLVYDGDFLRAEGTTLGADDAVAPALSFALLLDQELQHPDIEVFLTTDEEVGMISVRNADLSYLRGSYLINLDSCNEGVFTVGCAGGQLVKAIVPNQREHNDKQTYTIIISGLRGGHSGVEITKGRANALKLMGRFLSAISRISDYRISSLRADGKDNAITDKATCVIASDISFEDLQEAAMDFESGVRHMFRSTDPEITVSIIRSEANDVLTAKASYSLQSLLQFLPFGPLAFDQVMEGVIETSANIGPVETDDKGIGIYCSIRSSVDERKKAIADKIRDLCRLTDSVFEEQDKSYPAWLPDYDSRLLSLLKDKYSEFYGKEADVETTHGGLECGYILESSGIREAVAMGPDLFDEHTTSERLSVSSLIRTYDFLKAVLTAL